MVDQLEKNTIDRKSVIVSDNYYLTVDNINSADSSSRSPSPNRSIKGLNLFRAISRKIGKNIRKAKEDKCMSSDDDDDSNSSFNSSQRSVNKNQKIECDCQYYYKNERNNIMVTNKNRNITFAVDDNNYKKKSEDYQIKSRCLRFSTPCPRHHTSSGSDTYSSNDDSSASNDLEQSSNRNRFSSNDSSTSSSSGSYKNSTAIVRKVLKSLNLNSRSLSCSSITQMKDMSFNDRRELSQKEKRTKKSPQRILRQPASYTYVRGISGLPTHRVVNTRGCYNNQFSRGYC